MGKGLGKLQLDILRVIAERPWAGDTILLGTFLKDQAIPPADEIRDGIICEPDPADVARYHSQMQAIRRALRTLEHRGLVEAYRDPDDSRRILWKLKGGDTGK